MGELRDKMDRDMLLNSDAIFGLHAGKDRMPASFRKQQNIPPPLKKGGQGGFLSAATR
jgi:hypothetical protein